MRLGLAAWGLREMPLKDQLQLTRNLGLDLLEFSIANYSKDSIQINSTDTEIAEVIRLFKEYDISLECGCTGNDFTGDDVDTQVVRMKQIITLAAALGLKYLRIFAGFSSDSVVCAKKFDRMIEALTEVNTFAVANKITLCVETHGGVKVLPDGSLLHFNSVSTRCDHWMKILKTGVSICFDPANLEAVGSVSPVEFFKSFRSNIPYVHLKDFRKFSGGIIPAACGEGSLNWQDLMNELKSYQGPAMIEYELPEDAADGMLRSLNFIKRFI